MCGKHLHWSRECPDLNGKGKGSGMAALRSDIVEKITYAVGQGQGHSHDEER